MNNKWMGTAAAIVAGVTVVAGGQATQPGRDQSPTGANAQGSIIVTGCLQKRDNTSGTSSTSGAGRRDSGEPASESQFLLTSATRSTSGSGTVPPRKGAGRRGARGNAATGAAGGEQDQAEAAVGDGSRASSYELEGHIEELGTHVGHRIEVTGTMSSIAAASGRGSATGAASGAAGTAAPSAAGGARARSAPGASGSSGTASPAQRVQVNSVRMLSESCP